MDRSPWAALDEATFVPPPYPGDGNHTRDDSSARMLGGHRARPEDDIALTVASLRSAAAPRAPPSLQVEGPDTKVYAADGRGSAIDRQRRAMLLTELISEEAKMSAHEKRRAASQREHGHSTTVLFEHELKSLSQIEGYGGGGFLINPNCVALYPQEVRIAFLRKVCAERLLCRPKDTTACAHSTTLIFLPPRSMPLSFSRCSCCSSFRHCGKSHHWERQSSLSSTLPGCFSSPTYGSLFS